MLEEARCDDVAVLDVRPRECSFTDFFVLATGRSAQHVFTAAHAVKYAVCSPPLHSTQILHHDLFFWDFSRRARSSARTCTFAPRL